MSAASKQRSLIYSNRAETLRLQGDFARAFWDADAAERLDGGNVRALVRKAKVCEDLGDFARAVHYWKRAYEMGYSEAVLRQLRGARGALGEQI